MKFGYAEAKADKAPSLPSWERGLKLINIPIAHLSPGSLPSWERGLKCLQQIFGTVQDGSLPSWERGLKYVYDLKNGSGKGSLPSWERGLKFCVSLFRIRPALVAPFVGAWIEILLSPNGGCVLSVAPFVGAWIEMKFLPQLPSSLRRRSLRGSVD